MTTKFNICSRALIELGEDVISSFTDQNTRSRVCGEVYPPYIKYLQSIYPWNFTLKKVQLAKLVAVPLNVWSFQYQLPAQMLNLRAVYNSGQSGARSITDFEIQQDKILVNENEIFIDYQVSVSEGDFPEYFTEFAVKALAAKLARVITDDTTISEEKKQEAWGLPSDNRNGGEYGTAKRIDSLKNPTLAIPADDLVVARFSNGSSFRR